MSANILNTVSSVGDKPFIFQGRLLAPSLASEHVQHVWGKMATQYMSYAFAATTRVALMSAQARDKAALHGFMMQLGLGAMVYAMKQGVSGQPLSDNPVVWAAESFDNSGLSGWLMIADKMVGFATNGNIGINSYLDNPSTRWTPDAVMSHATGASGSWAFNTMKSVYGVSEDLMTKGGPTSSSMRHLRAQLPWNRIFYIEGLMEIADNDNIEFDR